MAESPEPKHPDTRGSASRPSDECWVFKLGGSLLDLPDLTDRLLPVIRSVSTKPLLIVGGGPAVDLVREWDIIHHLTPSAAHWLAVHAMDLNGRLIETMIPGAVMVTGFEEAAAAWRHDGIAVLNALAWLKREEAHSKSLPHSWAVTSDSIAAWAAVRWRAAGLMLLKSVDENQSNALDGHFYQLAPQVPQIAWCNLRKDSM